MPAGERIKGSEEVAMRVDGPRSIIAVGLVGC